MLLLLFWNNSVCNKKKNKKHKHKKQYVAPFSLPEKQRIHHEGTHILAKRKSSYLSEEVLILFWAEVGTETGQQIEKNIYIYDNGENVKLLR